MRRLSRRGEVKAKARENLEAALRLLERGLLNASASRLYFAAFQAAIFALQTRSRVPTEREGGARCWSHVRVEQAIATVLGNEEDRRVFSELRHLREKADYGLASV